MLFCFGRPYAIKVGDLIPLLTPTCEYIIQVVRVRANGFFDAEPLVCLDRDGEEG